jgi:diguanylate cyclase (GGDEF)-like protein/PAS domain S-box-containing protein
MFNPGNTQNDRTFDHRIRFLNSVFVLAGIVALGMSLFRWQASAVMGMIDLSFALCNFALVFFLHRRRKKVEMISSIALLLSYGLFTALYLLASYNTTRISLFFLLAASAFFLKGRKIGFFWLILILLTIVGGHFLPGFDTAYSHLDIITTCLYLLALYVIFNNYEIFNDKVHERERELQALHLSEERFRTLVESGRDIICILSHSGTVHFISPSVESILGLTSAETLNKNVSELLHPDEASKAAAILANVQSHSGGESLEKHEFRMKHKDGSFREVEIEVRNLLANPVIGGIVLTGHEVSERKQAEERLRLTSKVFENTLEGITITDTEGNIIEVNAAFSQITGYSHEELIGQNPRILQSGHQNHAFYEAMWRSITTTGHWSGEVWNRNKRGEMYPEWLSISAISNEQGEITNYVGISSDITLLKQHEKQLERIAHYDALTGIPNRTLLSDRMKQAIARTAREQNMMAVCYLDLDEFKPINDTLGHEAGDHVLIEIVQRIQSAIRGGDTVARLGGDEFVILLLGQERGEECSATLSRLLTVIAEPINIMGKSLCLSASIGVSIYPLDDEDSDTLLRHADQAMYVAKQSGKNRFHIYDPALDQRARDQQGLLKNIHSALDQNQFELYYQPKVDLHTQQITGAEALIRWNHPELGLLAPAKFLPAIENTELDILIGEWVIASALRQLDQWRNVGLDIEVSINISAYHLESSHFAEKLQQQLAQHPATPANRLQIEVLETVALDDINQVTRIIEHCKIIGVRFALDDFGTGYSSLSYLSSLPIDTLKIDQSFMRNLSASKGDHAIVLGIIALSKAFDLQTVAEGLETKEHFQTLREMGCDIGQGYGIARPMPASSLLDWAQQNRNGKRLFSGAPE